MRSSRYTANALLTLALSALLHGSLIYSWLHHHPTPTQAAPAQEMAVSVVAAESAPVTPLPELAKPEPIPEPEAEAIKPTPKPVVKKTTQEKPPEQQRLTPLPQPAAAAPPAPEPVITPATHDADYLHNPHPEYPSISRRIGEEGRVLLHVQVSAEGLPTAIAIKQSSGFSRLDEAARKTAERWRFVPAKRGNEAIASDVDVPIQFSLRK